MPAGREPFAYEKQVAQRAQLMSDQEGHAGANGVKHTGNTLLYHFFRELRNDLDSNPEHEHSHKQACNKLVKTISKATHRICTQQDLKQLNGMGPFYSKKVIQGLWAVYPPEEPTEEEEQLQEQQAASAAATAQANKDRKRKAAAEKKKEQQRQALQAQRASMHDISESMDIDDWTAGGNLEPLVGCMGDPGAGGGASREPAEAAGRARKAKPRKEYTPNVGTANYTFLIVLYQAKLRGKEVLGKQELMDLAEASNLSHNFIRGNPVQGNQAPGQQFYNGWSSFKRLENNEPPYVQAYSNPRKIRLTPKGEEVAGRLFQHALERGAVLPEPGHVPPSSQPQAGAAGPSAGAQNPAGGAQDPTGAARYPGAASMGIDIDAFAASFGLPPGTFPLPSQPRPAAQQHRSSIDSTHLQAALRQPAAPAAAAQPPAASGVAAPHTYLAQMRAQLQQAAPPAARPAAQPQQHEATHDARDRNPGGGVGASGLAAARRQSDAARGAATPAQQQVLSLLSDDEDTPAPRRYTHHPESDEDEVMCLPASNPAAQPNVRQNHATQIDPSSQCSVDTSSRTPTFDLSSPPRSRFAAAAQDVETPPKAPGGFEPLARGAGGGAAGGSRTEAARQQAPDSNVALLVDMGFDAGLAAKVLRRGCSLEDAIDLLSSGIYGEASPEPSPSGSVPHPSPIPAELNNRNFLSGISYGSVYVPPGPQLPAASVQPPCSSLGNMGLPTGGASAGTSQQLAALRQAQAASMRPSAAVAQLPAAGNHPAAAQQLQRGTSGGSQAIEGDHSRQVVKGPWRLPVLGGAWGVEERDIRLPPLPPGVTFDAHYELVVAVDKREQVAHEGGRSQGGDFYQVRDRYLDFLRLWVPGVCVEPHTLGAGDVAWLARHRVTGQQYMLDRLAERKSCEDLGGSIKQGRYDKQKYLMRRTRLKHLMYIVEGSPNLNDAWAAKALPTAAAATEVQDGFTVLYTDNATHTFQQYGRITLAVQEKYSQLTSSSPSVQRGGEALPTWEQFGSSVALARKITVRDLWGLMLTAVPGVGAEAAEAILKVFPTPKSLLQAYEGTWQNALGNGGNAAAAAEKLLQQLPMGPGRTIGIRKSQNMFKNLFANAWES